MPAVNSVTAPDGVMRPIAARLVSVNQRLPSGPGVMLRGPELGVTPAENSVMTPLGVMRAMRPGVGELGEPHVAVGAACDTRRVAVGRQPGAVLRQVGGLRGGRCDRGEEAGGKGQGREDRVARCMPRVFGSGRAA